MGLAKAPATEDALASIHAIRQSPEKYDLKRDLAPFLRHKSNHVIAAAAAAAEHLEAGALVPNLVEAFEKLMRDPAKLDQGCKATTAIVQALIQLDDPAARVYFAAIHHVQKEGSFGPPVDVAAPLRGLCARGLARMGHPDALLECVTLLADPEIAARTGAIRAIADSGRPDGVLLLRLKTLLGDKEIDVTGECFWAAEPGSGRVGGVRRQVSKFPDRGNWRTGGAGIGRIATSGGLRGAARGLGRRWCGGAAADPAGGDRDAQNR